MHFKNIICVCLLAGLLAATSSAKDKESFKINKLNVIFNKARHTLGEGKLKDLQSDLRRHEHDEVNLKKLKAHNQDKEGLVEAAVRRKLLTILKKYSLERYHDDIHPASAQVNAKFNDKIATSKGTSLETPTFRDSKLDKLWKKAEKAGFDQDQLMVLHQEFQHQQDKLDEHYRMGNLLSDAHTKSAQEHEKLANSIEHSNTGAKPGASATNKKEEQPADKKARLEANLEQDLKQKHRATKKGYEDLHEKIKSGLVDKERPFKEAHVNELWSIASKSNFTQEELDSLKEELEHYQTRIQKLKHFQYQLERQRIGVKDYSSNANEDDDSKYIRSKVDELSQKVDKAHQILVAKIIKDEL